MFKFMFKLYRIVFGLSNEQKEAVSDDISTALSEGNFGKASLDD